MRTGGYHAIALVAAQVGLSVQSREQAQTLLAPSFTAAQAAAGRATYTENCASCHGANLDDGAFGPALRGPEFRASWFGRSADQLFTKLETMPPGGAGDARCRPDRRGPGIPHVSEPACRGRQARVVES